MAPRRAGVCSSGVLGKGLMGVRCCVEGDAVCSPRTCLANVKAGRIIYKHERRSHHPIGTRRQRSVAEDLELELTRAGYTAGVLRLGGLSEAESVKTPKGKV